jgi:hypothetical protein
MPPKPPKKLFAYKASRDMGKFLRLTVAPAEPDESERSRICKLADDVEVCGINSSAAGNLINCSQTFASAQLCYRCLDRLSLNRSLNIFKMIKSVIRQSRRRLDPIYVMTATLTLSHDYNLHDALDVFFGKKASGNRSNTGKLSKFWKRVGKIGVRGLIAGLHYHPNTSRFDPEHAPHLYCIMVTNKYIRSIIPDLGRIWDIVDPGKDRSSRYRMAFKYLNCYTLQMMKHQSLTPIQRASKIPLCYKGSIPNWENTDIATVCNYLTQNTIKHQQGRIPLSKYRERFECYKVMRGRIVFRTYGLFHGNPC